MGWPRKARRRLFAKKMSRPRFIDPFQPAEVRRLVQRVRLAAARFSIASECACSTGSCAKALPGVDLHYALKPMPHAAVVRTVIDEGGFLDLATTGEVQLVRRLGVAPERCIHTHPIKRPQDIRNALDFGVRTFVADNPDEVRKFARLGRPRRVAAARVLPQPRRGVRPVAQVRLRPGGRAGDLARLAAELGIAVRGLSFHVGSQAADSAKHVEAMQACAKLMSAGRRAKLGPLDTLDIGGGFPIDYAQPVQDIGRFCAPLREALAKLPEEGARDRRARPLHRRARRDRCRVRDGARAARRALVVLPRRRALRLLQRPALRSRALSGGAVARRRASGCRRCWRGPPATASM